MRKRLVVFSLWMAGFIESGLCLAQEEHAFNVEIIDGNRIAWSCEGSGSPTVVLVAGMGLSAHQSFNRIYHNYHGQARICMYDRAGMAKSTFVQPRNRTLLELTGELHQLSAKQNWGKLVLVGHSFGGFITRAYAAQYPREVTGMLLLEATHEDWLPRLKAQMSGPDWALMEKVVSWNLTTFHEDYNEAQEQIRSIKFVDTLPVTVVSRGLPHTNIRVAKMSYDGVDIFNAEHDALQTKLVALSSRAEHRVARYSSHIIDDTDPWLAIEEIDKLVLRAGDQTGSNRQ